MNRHLRALIIRRPFALLLGLCLVAILIGALRVGWADLWATPDQRGRLLMAQRRYGTAADAFLDPMWRGAALMKAGQFKDAAQVFGGMDSAEAAYNQGNALVMLGKYEDAVTRYDRALALRSDWTDAGANREIARLRAARMKATGEDAGEQREGADEIVYDKTKKNDGGEDTQTAGATMSDDQVRALWLKRVQTRPADFLRARFAYQAQARPEKAAPP
jgi:Ca-activated chloride channel family protein